MALSDLAARRAKPTDKPRKLADEKGLYLLITPQGSKLWRWKYRFSGKEKKLSLGPYPEVSLNEARRARDLGRERLRHGTDPSAERRAAKIAAQIGAGDSFRAVAEDYITKIEKEGRADR